MNAPLTILACSGGGVPGEVVLAFLGTWAVFAVSGISAAMLSFTRLRYSWWLPVSALPSIGLAVAFARFIFSDFASPPWLGTFFAVCLLDVLSIGRFCWRRKDLRRAQPDR